MIRHPLGFAAALAAAFALRAGFAQDEPPKVNAGTDSAVELRAPRQDDGFSFVVFGDRTGGKPEGVRILEQGVETANRLDPDFVMTVGDMVQGYTGPEVWLKQAAQYRAVMSRLVAPWYPVVGNHDVYGGKANPEGNAALYKENFGPLYYSFDHRWAHVVCLFSDEALSFADPAKDQNLSAEQIDWLKKDLAATKAEQVLVFLHHPRWLYEGCNWPDVHRLLAADGRVRAVFCGHLHTYRDDGVRDGIHYFVLGMTGAEPPAKALETASFQHIAHVKVRRDRLTMALLPVGTVMGSDAVLGAEVDAMNDLVRGEWLDVEGTPAIAFGAGRESGFQVVVRNATDRAIPYEASIEAEDGWTLVPRQASGIVAAGGVARIPVAARAPAFEQKRPSIEVKATITYPLASGLGQPIRATASVPVKLVGVARSKSSVQKSVVLDGESFVRVALTRAETTFKQFTLECWAKSKGSPRTMTVVSKTEWSSFGIQWNDGSRDRTAPTGFVHLPRMPGTKKPGYVTLDAKNRIAPDDWVHLALVHDGARARLFVDGKVADDQDAAGAVTTNDFPLYVGADPGADGRPVNPFTGEVDEVRLSRTARYSAAFTPSKTFERDDATVLLLHFDVDEHGVFLDDSGNENHGWPVGAPKLDETRR